MWLFREKPHARVAAEASTCAAQESHNPFPGRRLARRLSAERPIQMLEIEVNHQPDRQSDQKHVSRLQPLLRAGSGPFFGCLAAEVKHAKAYRQTENRHQLHFFVDRRAFGETIEYEGPASIVMLPR